MLRLEADDTTCKIIFYEKSRIKSLIFLTIDLQITNEREIIQEMSSSLIELKEVNKSLSQQIALYNNQMQEKDQQLKGALSKNNELTSQFSKVYIDHKQKMVSLNTNFIGYELGGKYFNEMLNECRENYI